MEISRRQLLSATPAVAGVLLAGCAAGAGSSATGAGPSATRPFAPGGGDGIRPGVTATSGGSGSPAWSAAKAVVPTRGQVVATYAGRPAHEWGWQVDGVVDRLPRHAGAVALTFDACGGPGGSRYDHDLVALLRRLSVAATLFLNSRWITANATLAVELAADPLFALGNHGFHHRPLSVDGRSAYGIGGTRNVGEIYDEVETAAAWFVDHTGARPRYLRPGTACTDEVGAAIARRLGQPVVGFTVNGDAGATLPAGSVAANVGSARPGDIVISHMNQPGRGTAAGYAEALPRLVDRGVRFTTLAHALAHAVG